MLTASGTANSNRPTMTELLPAWPLLSAFLLASLVFAVTPDRACYTSSPAVSCRGRRAGLCLVAGVALGNLGNAGAAALGPAAFSPSRRSLSPLSKYAGAAHLIWFGVQMLRGTQVSTAAGTWATIPLARLFRDGFVVALLNPKTTVFSPPSCRSSSIRRSAHGTGTFAWCPLRRHRCRDRQRLRACRWRYRTAATG